MSRGSAGTYEIFEKFIRSALQSSIFEFSSVVRPTSKITGRAAFSILRDGVVAIIENVARSGASPCWAIILFIAINSKFHHIVELFSSIR
jgi:hypothetical protein